MHPELRMGDCLSGTGSAVRQCRGTAGGSLNWLPRTWLELLIVSMTTFVSIIAWFNILLLRTLQVFEVRPLE